MCSLVLGVRFLEYLVYPGDQTSGTGPLTRTLALLETVVGQEKDRKIVVDDWITEYNELHKSDDPSQRNSAYAKMVNAYYELATSFYEWGWGASFHFSYRMQGESFAEGIRRHEYSLASHLMLKPGTKVVDVGCGIGGPMRNITRFTGWDVTGITVNEYQVRRGNQMVTEEGLDGQCRLAQMDFMDLKFPPGSMDALLSSPLLSSPLLWGQASQQTGEKSRTLTATHPVGFEGNFDQTSVRNIRWIKKAIEEGDALPDMAFTWEVAKAMKAAGFEMVHERDMALDPNQEIQWHVPMTPSWNPLCQRFQFNFFGLFCTTWILRLLEFVYVVPSGTSKIQVVLQTAGMGCAAGGETGSFTPMY
ncbi:S-adenosyl-L-methionine-dependent methyltransferase, partial [Baffinella frigidus]